MLKDFHKLILMAIVIAGVSIAGTFFYLTRIKTPQANLLSPQEAAQKAINYINENLVEKGVVVSLVDVVEENGLYKFRLKMGEQEFVSYVTKDGKILFPEEGIDIEEKLTQEETPPEETPKTYEDIKKSDEPLLEAFVVSECPFGTQMQRILNEIVKNISSLANNIKVEYIGSIQGDKITSMHGDPEAQENLRQICLKEEQPDKYWNYIDCHIKKGEVEGCLTATGIDEAKLSNCVTDSSKGLKYAKEDFDAQEKYKVTGSPSLFLNGEKVSEFDFGGRTAEAVKTLLCYGFKTEPGACSQKLTEASAATGFSETYSQSSGSSGGSCE